MFGKPFKIGTILGFRIEVSFTFIFILALFGFQLGVVKGLIAAVVISFSIVAHELGHAVVARRFGIEIRGIELHLLGGVAKMARMPKTARDEILIAVAGPAVSFALAGAGMGLSYGLSFQPLLYFGYLNLVLGVFNLLPALPMDGGRVLRAALSARMGRYRATLIASTVSRVFAVLFVIVAISAWMPMLFLISLLLWFMAGQERRTAHMWRYEDEMQAAEVVDQHGRVISQQQGPGPVYTIPTPQGDAPPGGPANAQPGQPGQPAQADGRGPVKRVIRLPNGMVMVVEEYRW
jgi:Zn-dependent protease